VINRCGQQNELDRDKLAKVLGMLGSAHEGEIAAAGRAANQMIRAAGTTWPALCNADAKYLELALSNSTKSELKALRAENARLQYENGRLQHEIEVLRALETAPPEWSEPADEDEQIKLCIEWRPYLDEFERQFVMSLLGKRRLDRHQAAHLWAIVLKTRTVARRIGRTR
jgi:hypothetical protein